MLRTVITKLLAESERKLGYDMSYVKFVLAADLTAFFAFAKLRKISQYCQDVPQEVWHAVRIVGAAESDCGPCLQLTVTMAEQAGVPAETLRALVRTRFDDASLGSDLRLGRAFARAVLARTPDADPLREEILRRWGARGLVSLAFGLASARLYPTLKYALGYGRACSRVVVAGEAVELDPMRAVA